MGKNLCVGCMPIPANKRKDLLVKPGQLGIVESTTVITDGHTVRSRRFGFIDAASRIEARAAINEINLTGHDDLTRNEL